MAQIQRSLDSCPGKDSIETDWVEVTAEEVQIILKIAPEKRSKADIERLDTFFLDNNFFRETKHNLEAKTVNYLYRNILYQEHDVGETVFNYGEMGKLFYIILEGEVIVKTPGPHILEGEENVNPQSVLLYLIKYFRDIDWIDIINGEIIRRLLAFELASYGFDIENNANFDKTAAVAVFRNLIEKDKTRIHKKIYKIVNPEY